MFDIRYLIKAMVVLGLIACGLDLKKKSTARTDTGVAMVKDTPPEDSLGKSVDLNLNFGVADLDASLLSLDTDANSVDSNYVVDENITVNFAKLSIAAIKIMPKAEPASEEETLDQEEVLKDANELADFESTMDVSYSLTKPDLELQAPSLDAQAKRKADLKNHLAQQKQNKTKAEKGALFRKARRETLATHAKIMRSQMMDYLEKLFERDLSIRFRGPYVVDLISGAIDDTNELLPTKIADGSYQRIESKLRRNFDVDMDDPLFANVFVLKGTYKNSSGTLIPFEIDYHVPMNVRIRGDKKFPISPEGENAITLVFDLKKWFAGVDLSLAEKDETSGTIIIDKANNRNFLWKIRRNIKKFASFGKPDATGMVAKDELLERSGDEDTTDMSDADEEDLGD